MDHKYFGIILDKFDKGEADRSYGMYTQEEGRIKVIAKGVRKSGAKLAGFLEPITLGEYFVAKNRGAGKVTGAIIHSNYENIKNNFEASWKVFDALGIFRKIVIGQEKDRAVFLLLRNYLDEMERIVNADGGADEKKLEIISLGFRYKLIEESGYKINIERCGSCKERLKKNGNYFSADGGGVMCQDCSKGIIKKITIGQETIKLMRIFSQNDIKNYHKLIADEKVMKNLKSIIQEEERWITG